MSNSELVMYVDSDLKNVDRHQIKCLYKHIAECLDGSKSLNKFLTTPNWSLVEFNAETEDKEKVNFEILVGRPEKTPFRDWPQVILDATKTDSRSSRFPIPEGLVIRYICK